MKKETIASLILMFITYVLIAFVVLDFNVIAWHWSARAVMVITWFYGLTFLEKNKQVYLLKRICYALKGFTELH